MKLRPSARAEPPLTGHTLLGHRCADPAEIFRQSDAALLCDWPDAASISQAWFDLKYPGRSVPSPMLVLDAYLVDAPPFLT